MINRLAVLRLAPIVLGPGVLSFSLLAAPGHARAETALGDWGHFLSYRPKVLLNNPDGRAFTVTVHVMRWPVERFNRATRAFRLLGPGGKVVREGEFSTAGAEFSIEVPAGAPGVYTLEPAGDGGNVWVSSTLHQSVVWTGDPEAHAIEGRRTVFQASVPRRWWFWVPKDVTRFRCKAQRADRYMSQREDWGFFIITPRGQRIAALWGQPPKTPRNDYRRDQEVAVEVEPGAAGRSRCAWGIRTTTATSTSRSTACPRTWRAARRSGSIPTLADGRRSTPTTRARSSSRPESSR